MKEYVFLILVLLLAILIPIFININTEGFTSYKLDDIVDKTNDNSLLVEDSYNRLNRYGITDNGSNEIWWHYPIFTLGSYDQITNNIRYSKNPDEGTCMPASMCGSLYGAAKINNKKSNYVTQLPQISQTKGTRIGYFRAN